MPGRCSFWQATITKIRASAPPLEFTKPDTNSDLFISNAGNYWRDLAVQVAWNGYDLNRADMIKQASRLKHIYFNITGSPQDMTTFYFLSFYTDFCDAKKIACYIVHHDLGHVDAPLDIHLPFHDMFAGPFQDAGLDQLIQVFTRASSNLYGPIDNQSGFAAVAEEGEVTISGITLYSSNYYSNLIVTRTTTGAVGDVH